MPRFKQIAKIQQVMSQKDHIRNIGIVAHIDHGKTTLADSLLVGAGLLSPQMAGIARVLDYLDEEQKRKITIKTANISLLHKQDADEFLINLVDTPGHVDFTGKVTRALRAVDGVVVLVDAVEEIMAQTEIVVRQALEERVRPVLFINKVDRLITELQLSAEQIQQKLDRIIRSFNDQIELYGEDQFKDEWKVDPAKGTVGFGSALDGWGFTTLIAQQKRVKFTNIISAYLHHKKEVLKKTMPVQTAIFDMAIKQLPSPRQAQAYRVDRIWSGAISSKAGKAITECSDASFTVMWLINVHPDGDGKSRVTGRVFSGSVKKGDKLYCVNSMKEAVVEAVYVSMGSIIEEVNQVSAGNMVVLSLPVVVKAGETLVDAEHRAGMVPFESISYVSEPVMTVAIEPKNPKDIFALLKALHSLTSEDPNLNFLVDKETGEYLLSVMGELHLEVALSQLKNSIEGLELSVSTPRIVYRETVTKRGAEATAKSANRQNWFKVLVEPEEEVKATLPNIVEESGSILSVDEQRNVLLDCGGKADTLDEKTLESLIGGFEFACKAGPLCGEPIRHAKVNLTNLHVSQDVAARGSEEIMHGVGKAIFGSFLTAKPVLLEPIYKTVISTPTDLAGECSRILSTRRGKICSFEQKGLLTVITGYIPVEETFGLSKELRSASSGRAFWQNILDHWEQIPEKLLGKVIAEVRKRKGLSLEVPPASRFLEEVRVDC